MMDFNPVKYITGSHSIERVMERFPGTTEEYAPAILEAMAHNSTLLIESSGYRYLKYGDSFFLPCVKMSDRTYKICTITTWKKAYADKWLQSKIDKYFELPN